MQDQYTQPQKEQKEHKFLPRFIGIVAGTVSGYVTSQYLLKNALYRWVFERIHYGHDPIAMATRREVIAELQKPDKIEDPLQRKSMTALKERLEQLEKGFQKKKVEKLIDFKTKALKEEQKRIADGKSPSSEATLKNKFDTAEKGIEGNFKYFYNRAKNKIVYAKIAERMQLYIRHPEGRKWIFMGGVAALGAVGYATYKLTDHLMNGTEKKSHQQMVSDQRSTINTGSAEHSIS